MNILFLSGNLVKDLELKRTPKGTAVTDGVVAVSKEFSKEAYFIPFTAWGKQAEYLSKYAKKGTAVQLSGTLIIEPYTKNNGEKSTRAFANVEKAQINFSSLKETENEEIIEETSIDDMETPF